MTHDLKGIMAHAREEQRLRFTSKDAAEIAEFLSKLPKKHRETVSLWVEKLGKHGAELYGKEEAGKAWLKWCDEQRELEREYRKRGDHQ